MREYEHVIDKMREEQQQQARTIHDMGAKIDSVVGKMREEQQQQARMIRDMGAKVDKANRQEGLKREMDTMWGEISLLMKRVRHESTSKQGDGASCAGSMNDVGHASEIPIQYGAQWYDARGIDKCNEIDIDTEPDPMSVNLWLGEVAMATRRAYIYDGEYGFEMVKRAREHSEETVDAALKYPALEYQLLEALRRAIRSPALAAKISVRAFECQQLSGKPMTALRTLMIIIEHFEVSSAHEQAMFTQAIINMVCLPTYTETEEESLERFMCRWRVLIAQVKASRSCAWSDAELGIHLFRKIESLAVMTFDVEKWHELPASARTHAWIQSRVERRLDFWRAEKTREEWVSHGGGPLP